eukprot:scaffold73080_cov66-Phaeocystis_antarctica.AAC.3
MVASRSLLCLSASLMRASAWSMMAGVPVPHGRAQCVARQPDLAVSRHAVAPQMSGDGLSAEFQVRALAAGPRTCRRLVSQRSGTVFGQPTEVLREQKVDTPWVLIFNAGTNDEGMCARGLATTSPRARHTPHSRSALRAAPAQVHPPGPQDVRQVLRNVRPRLRAAGGGLALQHAPAGAGLRHADRGGVGCGGAERLLRLGRLWHRLRANGRAPLPSAEQLLRRGHGGGGGPADEARLCSARRAPL